VPTIITIMVAAPISVYMRSPRTATTRPRRHYLPAVCATPGAAQTLAVDISKGWNF
jgi:hypothetical protein